MNAKALQAAAQDLRHASVEQIDAAVHLQAEIVGFVSERVLIAQTLADFYRAPLSVSSLQPVLDLAVKLNPSLAVEKPHALHDQLIERIRRAERESV